MGILKAKHNRCVELLIKAIFLSTENLQVCQVFLQII